MTRSIGPLRLVVTVVALAALIALIALPVLAADPSGPPSPAASEPTAAPPATAAPVVTDDDGDGDGTQKREKPPKADKARKEPGEPVTVTGIVGTRTDADGQVEYTLTDGSTVVVLDAGPVWYYGDDHPLQGKVGQSVTVVGTQRAGDAEVEVETVDGARLREPGKPPWAGGWKVQGEKHPGWSAEKAAKWEAKRAEKARQHGVSCWPPGHCKDAKAGAAPTATNPPGD